MVPDAISPRRHLPVPHLLPAAGRDMWRTRDRGENRLRPAFMFPLQANYRNRHCYMHMQANVRSHCACCHGRTCSRIVPEGRWPEAVNDQLAHALSSPENSYIGRNRGRSPYAGGVSRNQRRQSPAVTPDEHGKYSRQCALVWKPGRILPMGWRAAAGADTIASDGRRGPHISRGATRHLHIDGDGPPARNGRAVFTPGTSKGGMPFL